MGVIERRLTSVAVSDILRVFVRCVCVIAEARLGSGPRWDLKEACAAKDDEVTREEVDEELEDIDEDKSAKIRAYIEQLEARVEATEGGVGGAVREDDGAGAVGVRGRGRAVCV